MLEFNNVSKSFWTGTQRKVILDRVSFRVELGRSLGILAPNGTGKTTLINIMAGLEKPDEGEVRRTCNVSFPLGFMGGVVSRVSAMENSRYIAKLYGMDPDYVESFCRWLCSLGEYFDQPIGTYSAGMRARLGFAISMAVPFDTYLIDEVTSVGDAAFRRKSEAILRDRLTRASAIVVSHSTDLLARLCTSGAVLENGRLFYYARVARAIEHHDHLMRGQLPPWLR